MKAMKGAEASLSLCQFGNDAAAYVGIGAAFGSPLFYVRSGVGSGRVGSPQPRPAAPAVTWRPGRRGTRFLDQVKKGRSEERP